MTNKLENLGFNPDLGGGRTLEQVKNMMESLDFMSTADKVDGNALIIEGVSTKQGDKTTRITIRIEKSDSPSE